MKQVFADTVGLIALWDRSDQWHDAAEHAFDEIVNNGDTLVTTSFVMLECANAASRRPYRNEVDVLHRALDQAGSLIYPTMEDWRQAWSEYTSRQMHGPGVVDNVSFIVMRRLAIQAAFTNDRHFRKAVLNRCFSQDGITMF